MLSHKLHPEFFNELQGQSVVPKTPEEPCGPIQTTCIDDKFGLKVNGSDKKVRHKHGGDKANKTGMFCMRVE